MNGGGGPDAKRPKPTPVLGSVPLGAKPEAARKVVVNTQAIGALPGNRPVIHPQVLGAKRPTSSPAFSLTPTTSSPKPQAEPTAAPLTLNAPLSLAPMKGVPAASLSKDKPPPKPAHTMRSAAGKTWEDPTLADWDPSNRIRLGNFRY